MEAIGSWADQQQGCVMKKIAVTFSLSIVLLGVGPLSGAARAATVEQTPVKGAYSAPALYDLGNFYARSGHPAMAVLNYERARVFAPRDPDIQANLRHVRESVGAPTPNGNWFSRHARWADPNTLYWIGIMGMILAGTSLLLRRPGSKHRTALAGGVALGVAFMGLAIGDAIATASLLHESVVMFATPGRASPIAGAEPLFTAPLADVVQVREQHAAFDLISDSEGREGWVADRDLQPVIPEGHPFRDAVRGNVTANTAPAPMSLRTDTAP
jgi:hypothetical protein